MATVWIFGAFSVSLLIAALLGPRVGRQIDAFGGNGVLAASSAMIAGGLVLLGLARGIPMLCAAWLLLGFGMGFGLYDSAFAALGRIYGANARRAITGITLIAGFASTVGWPLTAWGAAEIGWRNTCFAWAAVHILVGLPMNLFLLPRPEGTVGAAAALAAKPNVPMDRRMVLLSLAFASAWIVTGAMAAHFPRLLEASGATVAQAIAAGALIGPAQVAARMLEGGRRGRGECVRHAAWLGQWRPDHRAWRRAPGDLRAGQLWLPARADRRTRPHRAGDGAIGVRTADRPSRRRHALGLGGVEPDRVRSLVRLTHRAGT